MSNNLISVVIPAYNIESYITGCLKSLAEQTYKNLEIIIVDDGSTDSTPKILDQFSAEHNSVKIIHKENGGVSSARLCGIREATGDWIGFVDGDDWVEAEMYEHLLMNALKEKADISHCGYQMVFPNRTLYYYNTGSYQCIKSRDAVEKLLRGEYEPGLWNKLFKRELFSSLLRNASFDSSLRINEDLLMNYYLFREARMTVYEDVCPYHYQVRRNSASQAVIRAYKLNDPIQVQRILLQENAGDPELYTVCMQNLASRLVQVATISPKGQSSEIVGCVDQARRDLRALLPKLFRLRSCSVRTRCLSAWAAFWPASYRGIHSIYGELTGNNRKYRYDG